MIGMAWGDNVVFGNTMGTHIAHAKILAAQKFAISRGLPMPKIVLIPCLRALSQQQNISAQLLQLSMIAYMQFQKVRHFLFYEASN